MTRRRADEPMSAPVRPLPVPGPSVFDLEGFSEEVVQALTASFEQGEGSLFQNHPDEVVSQSRFLIQALRAANATRVVETGTHKGHFSYLARLVQSEVRVHTFGMDEGSAIASELLNARFGEFVDFHPGDSKVTLPRFSPPGQVDFAWIDGGHDLRTCLSDLQHCDRLAVPHVCVDDVHGEAGVAEAARLFVVQGGYELVDVSTDRRGIAWLRRRTPGTQKHAPRNEEPRTS